MILNQNKINIYFWILYCIYAVFTLTIFGYGVFFLEHLHFTFMYMGMIIGISALISSIIQPVIGRYADMKQFSWKNILIILTVIMLISAIGIFFSVSNTTMLTVLFSLMIIVLGCMYPFLNIGVFYYENYGINTNYGVSRGFASLSYMIFAAVLGVLLTNNSYMIINVFTVIAAVLMLVFLYLLPYYGDNVSTEKAAQKFKSSVLTKYPRFTLVLTIMVLLMIFHNIFLCYQINIFQNVGGNISDVSIASSIGAFLELPTMFLFYKILERVNVNKIIIFASTLYVVRALMILFATSSTGIYLSLILHIVTFALVIPASVHFVNGAVAEEDKYECQAFMGSTLTIGLIFANFLGGSIIQVYGVHLLLVIMVIITVISCILAWSTVILDKKSKTPA